MNRISLLFILLFATATAAHAGEVTLAVAANFTDATRDLVKRFERTTGHGAKVSYGSTGKLYAQITHGAPFELFLAADVARPERAEAEGLAVAGSRFTYARGRLALWSPRDDAFNDGEAYLKEGALSGDLGRLALANPKTAPYGAAAWEVMQWLGVSMALRPKLVRGDSIAQAFQFVASGNTDAGFVALSQVKAWRGESGSLWIVPEAYHTPIAQQAVLLERGRENPAAHAFLDFLRGPEAREVIRGYGYGIE